MNLSEFFQWTNDRWKGAQNTRSDLEILYIISLGLAGETGETVELLKKHVRDGKIDLNDLKLELGDVLHYWCRIASRYGLTPEEIMNANVAKLLDRDKHGKRKDIA